jgi:predicted delta-1-pyrroline-5-carboxylate dehydrogenase group 2
MTSLGDRFENERMLDVSSGAGALSAALQQLDASLPRAVPVWIGGERRSGGDGFASPDPCHTDRIVANAARATLAEVDAAVETARTALPAWDAAPVRERAEVLLAAASELRRRRHELDALLVRECGKTWTEAEAEFAEAVDFLECYARAAVELHERRPLPHAPGERNTIGYGARGVTAVIGPWNFPLAIPMGMAAAALVMGNPVVLKPAEQTPAAGLAIAEVLRAAGVPAGAVALVPGGGDVGAALVGHPAVDTVTFTGSMAVGLEIVERAARTRDEQTQVKRVIAEMGGKNCVIVAADADLDAAVEAIVASAFHFAGQKCSAASRVFVHAEVLEPFTTRIADAVARLRVGPGEESSSDVTAMIDAEACERVRALQAAAVAQGELVARAPQPPDGGWYLPPVVVTGLAPSSPLLREELFGPLLTLEPYTDLERVLAELDRLPYALTGGVFARSRAVIDRVIAASPVGNLYVNRKTTGAIVGRQPFGGNRRSGIGFKVGQGEYLLQFANARVVTEALSGAA